MCQGAPQCCDFGILNSYTIRAFCAKCSHTATPLFKEILTCGRYAATLQNTSSDAELQGCSVVPLSWCFQLTRKLISALSVMYRYALLYGMAVTLSLYLSSCRCMIIKCSASSVLHVRVAKLLEIFTARRIYDDITNSLTERLGCHNTVQ